MINNDLKYIFAFSGDLSSFKGTTKELEVKYKNAIFIEENDLSARIQELSSSNFLVVHFNRVDTRFDDFEFVKEKERKFSKLADGKYLAAYSLHGKINAGDRIEEIDNAIKEGYQKQHVNSPITENAFAYEVKEDGSKPGLPQSIPNKTSLFNPIDQAAKEIASKSPKSNSGPASTPHIQPKITQKAEPAQVKASEQKNAPVKATSSIEVDPKGTKTGEIKYVFAFDDVDSLKGTKVELEKKYKNADYLDGVTSDSLAKHLAKLKEPYVVIHFVRVDTRLDDIGYVKRKEGELSEVAKGKYLLAYGANGNISFGNELEELSHSLRNDLGISDNVFVYHFKIDGSKSGLPQVFSEAQKNELLNPLNAIKKK